MDVQSLETIELEMAILLRRVASTLDRKGMFDRSAYLLLHQITVHGSAGVKALADEFHLDISTVSRQAASLERKGYVYREPDPQDGRAFSLCITELGAKELAACKRARLDKVTEKLKDWSDEECQHFGQLLRKFNRSAAIK